MDDNPKTALEALVEPKPLTLAQVAILEMMDAPILRGGVDSLAETAKALWVLSLPSREAASRWREAPEAGLAWLGGIGVDEYRRRLGDALDAIAAFWRLLPRPDEDQKKAAGSATDGLPS